MVQLKQHHVRAVLQLLFYFNSIMVQLKPVVGDNVDVIVEFQFHNGTIKTLMQANLIDPPNDFNSIMVQLKPSLAILFCHHRKHFNSIMVQLKHVTHST